MINPSARTRAGIVIPTVTGRVPSLMIVLNDRSARTPVSKMSTERMMCGGQRSHRIAPPLEPSDVPVNPVKPPTEDPTREWVAPLYEKSSRDRLRLRLGLPRVAKQNRVDFPGYSQTARKLMAEIGKRFPPKELLPRYLYSHKNWGGASSESKRLMTPPVFSRALRRRSIMPPRTI